MKRQPSLKTIAEKTGFAVTTISKALNDAPNISAKTKAYVRQIADEMGYRPDRAGVSLRTGQTHKIVLLMKLSDELSDFSRRLIVGIAHTLQPTPYELVFQPILPKQDQVAEVKSIIRNRAADGIVLAQTAPEDERVAFAIEEDFPIVTHGRTQLDAAHAFYDFDNEAFAKIAVARLKGLGCKSVTLLAPEPELTYYRHLRAGLVLGAKQSKVEVRQEELPTGGDYLNNLRDWAKTRFANGQMADGLICSGELAALAVANGVKKAGGIVGQDVQIISRKTSDLPDFLPIDIHWVSEDLIVAGEQLAALLLQRIKGVPATQLQVIGSPEENIAD